MIKDVDLKETKRLLISQLVLSTLYFLFGVTMLIVKIIDKSILLDREFIIAASLITIGGIYALYCLIVVLNPEIIRKKTIKKLDPSNKDIKDKTIRNGYYIYFILSIFFMIIFYVGGNIDAFAAIFMVLFFVIILQFINWSYYKIKYNLQNREAEDDIDE